MKAAIRSGLLALAAASLPAVAHAHTGVGDAGGLVHGFMHPIGGVDHVLAMVAVGLFASILGGRALWLVPASFVVMMAVGGLLGMQGVAVPFVEIGIAASVVVLGLAVALRWNPPTAAAMGVVSLFAIFHGHAHGAEMPLDASGLQYALGFMAATALLHIAGIGAGLAIGRVGANSATAMRFGGSAMALAGVGLLSGYL
ncbi:HupE/UreJ family protein [Mycoplana sp. MJR14]|uniref:HupE/UreJ family protein n=1 Tax=Mycoplana sp. MJR14 TaxID=3032583 RepID=UPI000DD9629A|nr:HupE/UreJ family protein [Mycoplana sp. MJR14]MDF1635381.1 HupE/UreJ family protein [Mycoplana sp. MJR14]